MKVIVYPLGFIHITACSLPIRCTGETAECWIGYKSLEIHPWH